MYINELTVKGFRNLKNQTLKLNRGLNIFVGANAQGKTNLVESVYLCCIGKSPRTEKDKDLVMWGQNIAHVKAQYTCRYGDGTIAIGIDSTAGTKKHITVNSVPINKLGDLLGYLNCIYFSPNEIKIVSQSPQERRKFLDVDLCQIDKSYFFALSRFNKALHQRNNLLKSNSSKEKIKDTIFVWDQQIAENGAKVIAKRKEFCEQLKEFANVNHKKITDGKEDLELDYITMFNYETTKEIYENYLLALGNSLDKDLELRYTTVGCQRDDIALSVNKKDLRNFGSQGQLRTTALALKLSELDIFKKITGEMPILLLDDVLSELDLDRQKQLLNLAKETQVLLTTATEIDNLLLPKYYTTFSVKDGVATVK